MTALTPIGKNAETKRLIFLDQRTRSTHMHIIGSSGEGKSKFMEHLIREDIKNNNGLCLVDPNGTLFHEVIRWLETHGLQNRRQIIIFDPSDYDYSLGFNPLMVRDERFLSALVDSMVGACAKVWGGENTDRTQLLKRCLKCLFHVLAENNLTLYDSHFFISPNQGATRKALTGNIKNHTIREQWAYFNSLNPRQYYEEFGSTINRMMEFLTAETIRLILGQNKVTLDFRKAMDEGAIVLVNLSAKTLMSLDNMRVLGSLIVNDLFMSSLGRPEGSRPFYLYIDECALFINDDIARILDQCRKFGLHLILTHQHLSQLGDSDGVIRNAVMTNAKTKVIFGGLNYKDAEELARQVFLGELDLEETKKSITTPVVVNYIKTWLNNYSSGGSRTTGQATGISETTAGSRSQTRGQSIASNHEFLGEDHITDSRSETSGSSWSRGETTTYSQSDTESWSEGSSETYLPELEERAGLVFSLEEQIYKAMALMVNQAEQHAIIKLPKRKTQFVKTPTVQRAVARDERVNKFKLKNYEQLPFVKFRDEAKKEVAERWRDLEEKAQTICGK